ncbi:MAG TPA: T9SS type A sorting domain-containing protein [Bacteroidetes bacterium]|nr:T9SS type A sorting domain-containing protein [Bacteroidota bacterium]
MKKSIITLILLIFLMAGKLTGQSREIDTITFELANPDCIVTWTSDCTNCTFDLARISDFDPNQGETPEDGTFTIFSDVTSPNHDSALWQQPPGYYAYGVREVYSGGGTSGWVYSQIIPLYFWYGVSIYSIVGCDINMQDSLGRIFLKGGTPYSEFYWEGYGGSVYFDNVPMGMYDAHVEVQGFVIWENASFVVTTDISINPIMLPYVFPPRNMEMDTVSSMLSWEIPRVITLNESFQDTLFPPPWSWISGSNGVGWFRSDDGGSEGFPIPPHDAYYAVVNNDLAGENNDGCCDSLIALGVNLKPRDHFHLLFDSFFTGANGQTGTVFYSPDGGKAWDTLYEMTPDTAWQNVDIDLSSLSGFYGLWNAVFLFLGNDHGQTGSGWAIDSVRTDAGEFYPDYYNLYLNYNPIADEIPVDTNEWFAPDLEYGNQYNLILHSFYCGNSAEDFLIFNSGFLPPCENFNTIFNEDELDLAASWTMPTLNDSVPKGLTRFNVYMDNEIADTIPYGGQGIGDTITLNDIDFTSGEHELCVQANYDLTPYGFPGETGESLFACDSIDIVFTGLEQDIRDQDKVSIFPNPATNKLSFKSEETIQQITLINFTGQTVLIKRVNGNHVTLSTTGLKAGIYFARIKTKNGIVNKRIVFRK